MEENYSRIVAGSCSNILKVSLYNYVRCSDYEYFETPPDDFPKDKKFKKGVYFVRNYEYTPYTKIPHIVVHTDKYGVQHAYIKPKIIVEMTDGTYINKSYTSYKTALNKYKKLCKQANLFEL